MGRAFEYRKATKLKDGATWLGILPKLVSGLLLLQRGERVQNQRTTHHCVLSSPLAQA